MPGTIQSQTGITHTHGDLAVNVPSYTKTIVQTEQSAYNNTQIVGITEEAIETGDIVTVGVVYLLNLDTVNFVDIGPDDTGMVDFIRLLPGERWPFRLVPGVAIMGKADTAPVRLQVTAYGA